MFIKISASGGASLEDASNVKAFKVVKEEGEAADAALGRLGRADGGHVWIDPQWVRTHGPAGDAGWCAGFDRMLSYAKGAGWMDAEGAVRAHIEAE
jgi:hypothetical protein